MFEPTMIIAASALIGLMIVVMATLRGWQDYLALKRRELEEHDNAHANEAGSKMGAARIEISDLKERIRKLEAIANGVDL